MTVHLAQPLPECTACGRPTSRAAHAAHGGLCTACAAWNNAATVVGPQAADQAVQQLREWQNTVARIRRAEVLAAADRARRRRLAARRRRA